MGFIDRILNEKRRVIDLLEDGRKAALIRDLRNLGAEVDPAGIRFYGNDIYHDKDGVVIKTPSMYKALPDGIKEAEVRVPVALVDGLLFAACEYSVRDRSYGGSTYRPGGIGLFLARYYPCLMRLEVDEADEDPIASAIGLARRLEEVAGRSFAHTHKVIPKVIYNDWRDWKDVTVAHPYQVAELPPTAKPADWKDESRP